MPRLATVNVFPHFMSSAPGRGANEWRVGKTRAKAHGVSVRFPVQLCSVKRLVSPELCPVASRGGDGGEVLRSIRREPIARLPSGRLSLSSSNTVEATGSAAVHHMLLAPELRRERAPVTTIVDLDEAVHGLYASIKTASMRAAAGRRMWPNN